MTDDALPSWIDGPAKSAVVGFVTGATTPGEAFIEPADRIAVFDNDGTLWIEQPVPIQLDFIFRALAHAAQNDPDLAGQDPYKAILSGDKEFSPRSASSNPRRSGHWRKRWPEPGSGPPRPSSRPRSMPTWPRTSPNASASPTRSWCTNPCWTCSTC